jgi:Icc-related predicted phosphoesterase
VSDLHGVPARYEKLFARIAAEQPAAVFIGGDLLPSPLTALSVVDSLHDDFINGFLARELKKIKQRLGNAYPEIFIILGNDDGRMEEAAILDAAAEGVWQYCHNRHIHWGEFTVFGYSYIPPTPFLLKDWERYDVSRYVDPGCIPPEEGIRSAPVAESRSIFATIAEDLEEMAGDKDMEKAIFLFHAPPYGGRLDRAALDGKMIDHAPVDVHIGSIAIQRFIENRQPMLTLHGHVHESTRLTGSWQEKYSRTFSFNAAHDGSELSLIRFDLSCLEKATRQLIG